MQEEENGYDPAPSIPTLTVTRATAGLFISSPSRPEDTRTADSFKEEKGKELRHTYPFFLSLFSSKKKRGSKEVNRQNCRGRLEQLWQASQGTTCCWVDKTQFFSQRTHNTPQVLLPSTCLSTSVWKNSLPHQYCVSSRQSLTVLYVRLTCGACWKATRPPTPEQALSGRAWHFCRGGCSWDSDVQTKQEPQC